MCCAQAFCLENMKGVNRRAVGRGALLLMLQPLRSSTRPGHSEQLEETVTRTDAELDEFARAAQALYQIGRITIRPDSPLLYPEAGFFPLVWQQNDHTWASAIALPVSRHYVFVGYLAPSIGPLQWQLGRQTGEDSSRTCPLVQAIAL